MKLTVIFATVLSLSVVTQAIPLDKRRFGVEHTPEADATFQEIKDIAQGTDKEAQAGNLSGAMVRALLAKAPACDQQDRADEVIDLGDQLGGDKRDQLVKVAQTYRQLERNTPNAGQPSELCNKTPRHKELDGLTQAQDPTGKQSDDPKTPGDDPKKPKDDPKKPKDDPKKPKDDPKDDPKKPKDNPKDDPKKPKDDPKKPKDDPKKPKDDPKKPKDDPKKPKDDPKDDPKKPKDDPKDDPKKPKDDPKTTDPADGTQNTAETNPVGGVKMPKIVKSNGDFLVNGVGFNGNLDAAHGRQCDVQHNLCFNKFNSGDRTFSGADCDNQTNVCRSGPPVFE